MKQEYKMIYYNFSRNHTLMVNTNLIDCNNRTNNLYGYLNHYHKECFGYDF